MRKLTALAITTALITTACSIKHTEGYMDQQTLKEKTAVVQKNNPEQRVDTKAMQEELSGIASLKKFGTQMAIGAVAGSSSQAINMALSIASNYALDKTLYKDTYTVITDYENKELKTDSCSFNVKLLFKDEKIEREWKGGFTRRRLNNALAIEYKRAKLKVDDNSKNKITFYILDVENPNLMLSVPFAEKFPFVESVVEVEINNKLAGRYIMFGSMKINSYGFGMPIWEDLFSKIRQHCERVETAKEGQ